MDVMTDSSPIENSADEAAQVSDAAPESSTGNEGVTSVLDAVNAGLEKAEAPPASKEPGSEEPDPAKSADADELSEEEKQQYSKGAQRRIRELVEARKSSEAAVAGFQKEIETLKPRAEQLDRLTGFMREHEITGEHLDNVLGLTAAINRQDYDKALPVLRNLVAQMERAAGNVLPPELQKRVELGYITDEDARRLHRSELQLKRNTERSNADNERRQREQHETEITRVVHQAATTADAWHREQASRDPDWNLKSAQITKLAELKLRRDGLENYPRTPEAVRKLLDAVKSEVEDDLKHFRTPPKAVKQVVGGHPSPRSAAKPKSMAEAIDFGLEQANAG